MRKHQDQINFFLQVARELAQRDGMFHLVPLIEIALLENSQSPDGPNLQTSAPDYAQPRH